MHVDLHFTPKIKSPEDRWICRHIYGGGTAYAYVTPLNWKNDSQQA